MRFCSLSLSDELSYGSSLQRKAILGRSVLLWFVVLFSPGSSRALRENMCEPNVTLKQHRVSQRPEETKQSCIIPSVSHVSPLELHVSTVCSDSGG